MGLPDSFVPFCQAPHQFLLDMAATGPAARFRIGDEAFLVLSDPSSIHAVLNGKLDDFQKGALTALLVEIWGDGIITAEGENWVRQHAMFAPQFARRRIAQLEPFIAEVVTRQVEAWAALPAGTPVDILAAANQLAFDIVAEGLLGIIDKAVADGLLQSLGEIDATESLRLHYLTKRFGDRMQSAFGRSPHLEAVERIAWLCGAVADARLARTNKAGSAPGDLLGEIMATDAFAAFTPERKHAFLAYQVATLLSAGYVTTGESIFWGLYHLAKHPEAQARARAEVLAETDAAKGAPPMTAPPFLTAAYNESMRLYPAVWFMGREALRDIRVGDIDIAAGERVICSPYVLHRNPALWPEPDQYRPERFLPGAEPPVTPRSFIPFGGGMRSCLGRALALMEMNAIAGMTLARFELELATDTPVTLCGAFSMHPRERVLFRLKPLS